MTGHKWTPIRPLHEWQVQYDFSEIDSLNEQWLSTKAKVEASTPDAYDAFMERLYRRWSIETGVIEGIYRLDRGITETLVERGITAEYIERSATDREPAEVVRVIEDHRTAVNFINEWIENSRPLSKWFVSKLHSIICANQDTFRAVNQFGHLFDATLKRGEFKTQPNNPTRPDGTVHEYAPPEQVDSEVDMLVYIYEDAQGKQYHPLLQAAWVHHAFSTIHPFQDGNGRVGRGLLTWHMVRNGFLPIVISRDGRAEYIDALECADGGDMSQLADLIVRLEKGTILEALGQPGDTSEVNVFDQVLDGITDRFRRRQEAVSEQVEKVNAVALSLREHASGYLEGKSGELAGHLAVVDMFVSPKIVVGGPDKGNEHWYRRQILETANKAGHWVNLNERRYFVRMTIGTADESGIPWLVFVVSLHHTGRQSTGQIAASAFAEVHYQPDTESTDSEGGDDFPLFKDCTLDTFTLTWNSEPEKARGRFDKWLEESLVVALRYWYEYLEV